MHEVLTSHPTFRQFADEEARLAKARAEAATKRAAMTAAYDQACRTAAAAWKNPPARPPEEEWPAPEGTFMHAQQDLVVRKEAAAAQVAGELAERMRARERELLAKVAEHLPELSILAKELSSLADTATYLARAQARAACNNVRVPGPRIAPCRPLGGVLGAVEHAVAGTSPLAEPL